MPATLKWTAVQQLQLASTADCCTVRDGSAAASHQP